ncbi:MAG: type I-U CRISPR-associated protein Csb2 [Gemmatales bacterium]
MPSNLVFTFRFLQPFSHGRGEGGEPEWPLSPLRLYQSLVSASAGRWNERHQLIYAVPALEWLASLQPPEVVAAAGIASDVPTQFYVPDNTTELLVPSWKRGEVDKTPKRTEKVVRPTHLLDDTLHYLYVLPEGQCEHLETLKAVARSITHLGWGIDMVAADANIVSQPDADKLPGHRWHVVPQGGVPLRVPKAGTLQDLMRKHQDFLDRISGDGFKPVPPLREFDVRQYHSDTAPRTTSIQRPFAAFRLMSPSGEGNSAFRLLTGTRDVAGMMRNLLGETSRRFDIPHDEIETFIHGHRGKDAPVRGDAADRRLMFLPLPTISAYQNRVQAIRRVLVVGPIGSGRIMRQIQIRLGGEFLTHHGQPRAMLEQLSSDGVLKHYTGTSAVWSTVTPCVFPGHHKGDLEKGNELAYRMFTDAGLPQPVELAWRSVGFRPGAELANRYQRPHHMNGSMYHLRVRFPRPLQGPLVLGAGRYRGFGLFAAESSLP